MFNMNRINILWSFSSIETSISEIFAIKNCYFLALIFVERSERLSVKTACDESTWCRIGLHVRHCFIWCHVDSTMTSYVHDVGCLHCVLAPCGNLETKCAHHQVSFFFLECTIWPVPLALVLWESWLLPGEVGFDKCYKMLSFCCFLIHLHYLLYFLAGYKLHNTFELHSVLRQQVSYGWSEHWQTLCGDQ